MSLLQQREENREMTEKIFLLLMTGLDQIYDKLLDLHNQTGLNIFQSQFGQTVAVYFG